MNAATRFLSATLLLLGLTRADAAPIDGCEPKEGLTPICAVQGSEDMEVLPHAQQLIVSGSRMQLDASGMRWQPGAIGLLDLKTRVLRRLYPSQQSSSGHSAATWGDAHCPGEIGAQLSPHGIHLSQRSDGHWQLLVVNHGGRESIELFELMTHGHSPADDPAIALEWRGCAVAPAHSSLNDTAALPDGFVVTVMIDDRESMQAQMERAARGENTGHVLRWDAKRGYQKVPGSEGPMPNGIQTNRDGTLMFVALNATGEVRKYDLPHARVLATAKVPRPDNLSWAPDGSLLVAGLQPDAKIDECMANFLLPCGAASHVYALDPATMKTRVLWAHEGAPMGMATVAVRVGKHLYVGSVAGDRILQVPL